MFDCLTLTDQVEIPIVHEQVVERANDESWNIPLNTIAASHLSTLSDEALDKDWKLPEFFGTIAVINLPNAKTRLKRVTRQLHKVGTDDFDIFPAIDGRKELPKSIWNKFKGNRDHFDSRSKEGKRSLKKLHQGEAGCYMSHYLLIKNVKDKFDRASSELLAARAAHDEEAIQQALNQVRKYSRVLILEDDIGFGIVNRERPAASRKGTGRLLRVALAELPDNWDLLYLIVNPSRPIRVVSPHLNRLRLSWCAAAYAVNYTMYERLIRKLEKIENPFVKSVKPVDLAISSLHFSCKAYAINPSLVYHQAGPSQISSHIKKRLWQGQPIFIKQNPKEKPNDSD